MRRAFIVTIICLCLLILAAAGTRGGPIAGGEGVLHVGGSGNGNYTSISDAVQAAAAGDRIVVHPGRYTSVVINKPLVLKGQLAVLPSIDISADSVAISGFIVTGDSHGITITGSDVAVSNCSVLNHTYGFKVEGSRASITGNHIYRNTYYGLWIRYAESCSIENNDVYRNHEGIYIYHADGVIIENNTAANNSHGIHLEGTRDAVVYRNLIADNDARGVYYCCHSEDNTIYGNTVIRNDNNALGYGGANTWNVGRMGNYWDDYDGNGNYVIDDDNVDRYLLRQPVTVASLQENIYIISPSPGQKVSDTVVIRGVAEQAEPVAVRVDNGPWTQAQGTYIWQMKLNTAALAQGNHTLTARCRDATATLSFSVDNKTSGDAMPMATLFGILISFATAFVLGRRRLDRKD